MPTNSARTTLGPILGLLLLLFAPNLHAADTIASSLKATLLGKQLFLRNFSAEKEQKFIWKDDHLAETTSPGVHALIALVPRRISGDDTSVSIHGKCFIAMFDNQTHKMTLSSYSQEISLQIIFQQPPSAATEQAVENFLFFPDAETASKAVPPAWRSFVPLNAQSLLDGSPLMIETASGWKQVGHDDPNLQGPVPVDRDGHPVKKPATPTPPKPFSRFAALHRGALGLLIDPSGKIRDVWILSPVSDMEVTDSFVRFVSSDSARFKPAQWQDQPVRCILPVFTEVDGFVPPSDPATPY